VRDLDTTDEGVVRGTLRGGTASTLYIAATFGNPRQQSAHDGELVIATADGDVALEGDLRVAAGARVEARRRRLPTDTPPTLAELEPRSADRPITRAVLHQVGPDDEVIAKGTLVHEASDEATGYRENATRRVLRGSIAIAARHPTTHVVRLSLLVLGVLLAAGTFIGYKIEGVCGDAWSDTCRAGLLGRAEVATGRQDLELTNGNACVMANAMPNQDGQLKWLLEMLDRKATPSEAALQERITIARLVDDCARSVGRLQQIDRPELVIEEARRCGDFEAQQIALAELGRFARRQDNAAGG